MFDFEIDINFRRRKSFPKRHIFIIFFFLNTPKKGILFIHLLYGRFYKFACDEFSAIVPEAFVFREGAQRATWPNEKQKPTVREM